MKKLLMTLCDVLGDKCIEYKGSLLWNGETQINTIAPYRLDEILGDDRLMRVSINLLRDILPKTVKDRVYGLYQLRDLPSMEVTMLESEAEIIGVWLGLAACGVEPPKPIDLLCWPSGDYAWTLAAAIVGQKAGIVTMV